MEINKIEKTKNYVETIGVFVDADTSTTSSDGTEMYFLNYKYLVNDITYYCLTDYTTSIIPKIGSEKTIKYNPENPSESYIKGLSGSGIFYIIGVFFFFIPLIMLCEREITRNISIFIFANLSIFFCIYGEIYKSFAGVIFILVPCIMWFSCVRFFILYINEKEKQVDEF